MIRIFVLLACVTSSLACWEKLDQPIGVVVITLDTTRADRLTPYGFRRAEMPHLDRLAREGVVFEQASSVAPLTLPAHASLFTGLLPAAHGLRENSDMPLSFDHTTLAEILRAQGFRSAAFVGSAVLDPNRGLIQGFERYSGVIGDHRRGPKTPQRTAAAVVNEAIYWLDGIEDSRFLLWTHLYDPHRPYEAPEPFASRYADDPYVGEIAYADFEIGRLLEALERKNLLERTLVIVAGDHGESLGEHGERDHGVFVYENVLRVPLIIRGPTIEPRRVPSVVRLIDVMPTVLDLLRLPRVETDGVSLTAVMNGEHQQLEAYAESVYPQRFGWSPVRSLRDGRFKLIDAPRPELYDLDHDPFEQRNLFSERPSTAAAMSRRLASFGDGKWWTGTPRHEAKDPPRDVRERLSALGYVTGGPTKPLPATEPLRDAKDFIGMRITGG